MPLIITLRRNLESSPFRRQLQRLCSLPAQGDIVLCSGYIWEPQSGYSVLEDELLSCITSGSQGASVTTVAGKLQTTGKIDWLQHYKNFVARLRKANINVVAYIAPKRNWHAKIAIKLNPQGCPVAAVVGSSNLTGPAYREGGWSWNYECDVTMWQPNTVFDSHLTGDNQGAGDAFEEIGCILDPAKHQPNEEGRLLALYKDVLREKEEFKYLEDYEG